MVEGQQAGGSAGVDADAAGGGEDEDEGGTAVLLEDPGEGAGIAAADGLTAVLLEEPAAAGLAGEGAVEAADPTAASAAAAAEAGPSQLAAGPPDASAAEDEGALPAAHVAPAVGAVSPNVPCCSAGSLQCNMLMRPVWTAEEEYRSGEDDDADNEATIEEEEALAAAEGRNIQVGMVQAETAGAHSACLYNAWTHSPPFTCLFFFCTLLHLPLLPPAARRGR